MNLFEHYTAILDGIKNLYYRSEYIINASDNPYKALDLKFLRQNILELKNIPFLTQEIGELENSWLFKTSADIINISSSENSIVETRIAILKIKLDVLKEITEESGLIGQQDMLYIKLPELKSFDELAKISNDLKKAIEIPIIDESINGSVDIIAADKGSIILYAALGTILAVKLIAGICWAAMVIRRKSAEAKIFEAHAKTLELKNDSLQNILEAQKQQIRNILQAEAEAIASKHYSHNDPETIERLKLSISTVSDLIEKGIKILPMNNNDEIQKSFPDYNALNIIESTIKQLKDS